MSQSRDFRFDHLDQETAYHSYTLIQASLGLPSWTTEIQYFDNLLKLRFGL